MTAYMPDTADVESRVDALTTQLRGLVDEARKEGKDEDACAVAAVVAESIDALRMQVVEVRDAAAESILRRDPATHRPYEVAKLMRVTRARIAAMMRGKWRINVSD